MKNKKIHDKKIYVIFVTVLVVLYGVGYLIGRVTAHLEDSSNFEEFLATAKNTLAEMVPPFFIILAVIALLAEIILYVSRKKMYKKLQDHPDDELWDLLEDKLNVPMILANVMQIVNVFFFGCVLCITEFASYGKDGGFETAIVVIDVIFFVLLLVSGMCISKGIVDIEKRLSPEKQGNVFDFRFNEVWLASCDEGQKLITYRAAYRAFKSTNITCIIMCILSFIGMFLLKTGIYPMLCVCVIWLVNNLSYMLRAAKLEKR